MRKCFSNNTIIEVWNSKNFFYQPKPNHRGNENILNKMNYENKSLLYSVNYAEKGTYFELWKGRLKSNENGLVMGIK